jgi:NAD(P)H-hydrate epimerase
MSVPLPSLPPRKPDSHKGDFGRALLVGGSRGMAGAIALSGIAALRSGAGLVKLAVPDLCLDVVAGFDPVYMTVPLPDDAHGRITLAAKSTLVDLIEPATCVALGPGLGKSDDLTQLVAWLYTTCPHTMVIDADALNALATRDVPFADPAGPRVFTPHPGEFSRLLKDGERLSTLQQARRAEALAKEFGVVIVLKGHRSLITDGERSVRNNTGNPGMAKGGSGDVLTGIITALVCQGLAPFEAAHLGCHIHGAAGDMAAMRRGEVSMTARDILRALPHAFRMQEDIPF